MPSIAEARYEECKALEKRIEELEAALRVTCDAVERIAFQIPAPNDATPQLVERVDAARMVLQRK